MYLKVGLLHGPGFLFARHGRKSHLSLDVHKQFCNIMLLLWVWPGLQKSDRAAPLHRSEQRAQQCMHVTKTRSYALGIVPDKSREGPEPAS